MTLVADRNVARPFWADDGQTGSYRSEGLPL